MIAYTARVFVVPANPTAPVLQECRQKEVLSAQVRLLYDNANVSVVVTLLASAILARLQWDAVAKPMVLAWWISTALIAAARYVIALQFRRSATDSASIVRWRIPFAVGALLAGILWGAAGILLYPQELLPNQIVLAFVLGGMMLGAGSLLAPRPEAYLAFIVPTGVGPTIRLLMQGDDTHLAMGLLGAAFTAATLMMTRRICSTVDSSLRLRFENQDLLRDLLAAKLQTQALNEVLEQRVKERTAELERSTEQLRAEIIQREQVENELWQARKLESLGVLAGGIAHDFNNFLTIVQGNVQVAKSQLDPGDPAQNSLDVIANSCRRAAFLSAQLLTFAKGGAPVRRFSSVKQLITDAVDLARAGDPVTITVETPDELPFVEVDPNQIVQVLHNLLLNARQAMPSGGIIEVRADVAPQPGPDTAPRVRISVRDYGAGIKADVLPRIFDPYFTTRQGASGLGLATAYAIVTKHGGHISVSSTPGRGATFTFDLPASRESTALPPPEARQPRSGRERVLVMDDEEALRNLLRTVLIQLGYEVVVARDGAEAIALYEQAKSAGKEFDVVLLDLTVSGGMGGVEAAAKLKEISPSSRLIVSSGYSGAEVMSDFARYHFDAVVPKPWTSKELAAVFRKVLVGHPERKSQ